MNSCVNDEDFVNDFNFNVCTKLFDLGYSLNDNLVIGVSGGADSISLLTSIVEGLQIFIKDSKELKELTIYVLTINHNIRQEDVSLEDCNFVKSYCNKLNKSKKINIICKIISIQKGKVFELAQNRQRGIEEAARFFRYEEFEKFCYNEFYYKNEAKNRKVFFCLAHNQNDQIETLIMRFLQGASTSSRTGILPKRKSIIFENHELFYIRPLLDFSRNQIEKYLSIKNIPFKTDSTNLDNSYLRNRIRNCLMPVLKENFEGYENALLSGMEKAKLEKEYLDSKNSVKVESSNKNVNFDKDSELVSINQKYFYNLQKFERLNLLYDLISFFHVDYRVSFLFLRTIFDKESFSNDDFFTKQIHKQKNGLDFFIDKNCLFIKKIKNKATISGFFDIIEDECVCKYDFGTLFVEASKEEKEYANLKFVTNENQIYFFYKVCFPFIFRSRQLDDFVFTKQKKKKSVSDVFSDFGISSEDKNYIPIIESLLQKKIICIWGSLFGYRDWIL